jgi:hypothetical protein
MNPIFDKDFIILSGKTRSFDDTEALEAELSRRGLAYIRCEGVYRGEHEHSFLVPWLDYCVARELAKRFNQESFLDYCAGKQGMLYFLETSKYHPIGFLELVSDSSLDHTSLPSGERFTFAVSE